MSRSIDCENFMECLEGLATDAMPGENLVRLEKHAEGCPDCAMLLRMHAHLANESLSDIEASVPDDLVAGMWPRLTREMSVSSHPAKYANLSGSWQGRVQAFIGSNQRTTRGWLVPALAATVMILLFAGGYLLGEVNQLKQREQLLVTRMQQPVYQTPSRTEIEPTLWPLTTGVARVAGMTRTPDWLRSSGVSPSERARLAEALSREQDLSVAQLANLLARLSPQAVILEADAIQAGRWPRPYQRDLARIAAAVGIPIQDGLQAGEALQILQALNLNPERTFSTTRLLVLATGHAPGNYSRAGRRVRPLGEE